MKKIKILGMIAGLGFMVFGSGCSYVKQGEVGVIINKWGTDKGIQTEEIGQGYTWTGIRKDIVKFPTYKQNYVWTADDQDTSPRDESLQVNTSDGLPVGLDIGITYAIIPERADEIFAEYKMGLDEITDKYVRNIVRDEVTKYTSTITCEELYGSGKETFITTVQANVIKRCGDHGFIVESLYLVSRPDLPKQVTDSIAMKIQATQKAQMRENEVAEAKASADKARAVAEGEADAYLSTENAKIEIMEKQAIILNANPSLIQWKYASSWNGELPNVTGGAIPMFNVSP